MNSEERAWWTPERIAEYEQAESDAYEEDNKKEFPRGEFAPQCNVGPLY